MAMKSNTNEKSTGPEKAPSEVAARSIARGCLKAALATLDRSSGHPNASLVTVATALDASPIVLISRLALHTQNILADARASVLFDASGSDGDPLAGGRVTFIGRMERTADAALRRRFLARHPEAEGYADFPDFGFFRLAVERAHFVGGFGRIVPFEASQILLDVSAAGGLAEAEPEILAHMNEDHAAAVELYATRLAGAPGGAWRMVGIDPEGCDVMCAGDARRIPFAVAVTTPALARQELARLAAEARERTG
jgi:hypothetical protein